ncbi:twisted gastrulation-like protein, partial [Euroglyphus maynei]
LCESNESNESENIQQRSNVGHIQDPQPDFFTLLTESPDPLERWKTISYSLILPIEEKNLSKEDENSSELEMKCTVAYMAQCLSMNKCRSSCASMGSTTFRWFHDGCCECVGQYCNEFGLDKSNCTACPFIITGESREDL